MERSEEIPTPIEFTCRVQPEWLDYNDHMNVAFYIRAFDMAFDVFMDWIGMDDAGRAESGGTIFAAEAHVSYLAELRGGAPLRITLQLLEHDAKKMRTYLEMFHQEEGYLAASAEFLSLYGSRLYLCRHVLFNFLAMQGRYKRKY